MEEQKYQAQLDDINKKLDFIMEELHAQKEKREVVEDLVSDVSIVGKDMFKAAVVELDNAGVEVDSEAITGLLFAFMRNIDNIRTGLETIESLNDLMKDVTPIAHQVGLDGIHMMNDLEQKGYFDFLRETKRIMDNVVGHFSSDDVRLLADNIVTILETVKSITQPEMLEAVNNGLTVFKNMDTKSIPEYSLWKAMREFNSPEMKKGLGFMITFLKNMAK
ncbi:MAG: DUF1641 domain-containing protein [Bacteroidales bacterium]|nr:DUF1641 domain-containing protein [Bacteroidales bacterium]